MKSLAGSARAARRAFHLLFVGLLASGTAAAASLLPVSRTAPGAATDAANAASLSGPQSVSADGRYVVYLSGATNIVPGQVDLNGGADVFLLDRQTGTQTLVSRRAGTTATAANQSATFAHISPSGRFVVFATTADDLVAGFDGQDTTGDQLYVFNRETGSFSVASSRYDDPLRGSDGITTAAVLAHDVDAMVFASSSSNLIAGQENGDQNNGIDLFYVNLATNARTLITRRVGGSFCLPGFLCTSNRGGAEPVISADGEWVAFVSTSTDLATGISDPQADSNDVFLWRRSNNATTLVSRINGTSTAAGARSEAPSIAVTGTPASPLVSIAYLSRATNIVASQSDTNGESDVFLWNSGTNTSVLVTHLPGSATATDPDAFAGRPAIAPDASRVGFTSTSRVLMAGQIDFAPLTEDLFVYDPGTTVNTLVTHTPSNPLASAGGSTMQLQFSRDGTRLVFTSRADNLVVGQTDLNDYGDALLGDDVYLANLAAGTKALLSHVPGNTRQTGRFGSFITSINGDGTTVVFSTDADDLADGKLDRNDARDVLAWTATGDTRELVSARDAGADPVGMTGASEVTVSHDGRYVAFVSKARNVYPGLVDDDTDNFGIARDTDVFLLDRTTGNVMLVSRKASDPDTTGENDSNSPQLSGDGRYVVFASASLDLVAGQSDGNNAFDVFLFDRTTREVRLVSHAAAGLATTGDGVSGNARISRDGNFVTFTSTSKNLVAGQVDGDNSNDVFVYERATGTVTLASRTTASATTAANASSLQPTISADGAFVAFQSTSTALTAAVDTNAAADVFVFNRAAGTVARASNSTNGGSANGESRRPVISANGRYVAFESRAGNLVSGFFDANGPTATDVFRWDRLAGFVDPRIVLASRVPNSDNTPGNDASDRASISDDGTRVLFRTDATDLLDGQVDSPLSSDLFVFDANTEALTLVSESAFVPREAIGGDVGVISGDGSSVLFETNALSAIEGSIADNPVQSVYLRLVDGGTSILLSRGQDGPSDQAATYANLAALSGDASVSVFTSPAADIAPFDGNAAFAGQTAIDAFVFARAIGAPSIAGPSDQVIEEDALAGPFAVTVSDVDGPADDLLVTAKSDDLTLFPFGSLEVTGTGASRSISLQPGTEQSGTATITLRAVDGDGNVAATSFVVTVNVVNDQPLVAAPGDVTILEGTNTGLLDFQLSDSDHSIDEALLTVGSSDPAVVPNSGIALAGSGTNRRIRVTPAPNRFGDVTITIAAEDPDAAVGSSSFVVHVVNVNDEPSFAKGADVTIAEDAGAQSITGWATAIDAGPFEASQTLAFTTLANSNPSLFAAEPVVTPTGTLQFEPAANAFGTATIGIRLADDGGVADGGDDTSPTATFTITVNATNDLPTITAPATASTMEDTASAPIAITLGDVESAPDAITLTATSSNAAIVPNANLTIAGTGANRTLVVGPLADANGTLTIMLTATDPDGGVRTADIAFTVGAADETADVSIAAFNNTSFINPGTTVTWTIAVDNAGPGAALDVAVSDTMPAGVTNVGWTCAGVGGGACETANGTGALDVQVDLPAGGGATITLTGTVGEAAGPTLDYAVEAAVGAGTVDPDPSNNTARDVDAVGEILFNSSFEDS